MIVVRNIAFHGAHYFPIVDSYQGREALYFYLNAPLFQLIGDRLFTLRFSSAMIGLLGIAAAMGLGRGMFPGRRGVIVGIVAGVLMTLSFPQIFQSRQIFRAISLPTMQALALLFLWRGLNARRRAWVWLLLGGCVAGGTLYTYMASRLFPFWLGLGGLLLLWLDRAQWRRRLPQGVLFFAALLLTALPMIVYAFQRPDVFWGRLEEVTQSGQAVSLWDSIVLHLRMFFIEGDPYLRYNIPGRPYFTPPEGLLLLLGLAVAGWRLLCPGRASERSAYALLLLSPLMVLPSVISVGGFPPSHMRSLGMVPLIFLLVAVGFETLYNRLLAVYTRRRDSTNTAGVAGNGLRPSPTAETPNTQRASAELRGFAALTALTLLVGAPLVGSIYLNWAARTDLFIETDADLHAAALWLADQPRSDGTHVYLGAKHRQHPTVMIEAVPPITWLGTDSLFRAPPGDTGLYVFPRSAPPPEDWQRWLQPGAVAVLPLAPDSAPAFQAFRLPGDTPLPEFTPNSGTPVRSLWMTLLGTQSTPLLPDGHGDIVMFWQIDTPPPYTNLTPTLRLTDATGIELFRSDVLLVDTHTWQRGAVLMQRMRVRIPVGTPPGSYALRLGWADRATNTPVAFVDEENRQAGFEAVIGTLEVIRPNNFPPPDALPPHVGTVVDVAPGVRLLGWQPGPEALRPGETFTQTLYWQAISTDQPRAAVSVQALLRTADGGETMLVDSAPVNNTYPSDQWLPGELVVDHLRLALPRDLPGGVYALVLRVDTVELELGTLEITGVPRLLNAPPVMQRTTALFGADAAAEDIALYGYTLTTDGSSVRLELVWQSVRVVGFDYYVFVHLLDSTGQIIRQRDVMPQDNGYPTSLWLPGEFVLDVHIFAGIPRGSYTARVGLYRQETGERLYVIGEASQTYVDLPESVTIQLSANP